jgi:nucleotide-binding universal stress UspA family protein
MLMTKIKRILCPLDFSDTGKQALDHAVQLALFNKASIHLLHVLPQMNYYDWNTKIIYPMISEELYKKEKEASHKLLMKAVDEIKRKHPSVKVSTELIGNGMVSDVIIDTAKSKRCELIVMGSHGRKGLNRFLVGSDAEMVLRHAPMDVIIYRKKK